MFVAVSCQSIGSFCRFVGRCNRSRILAPRVIEGGYQHARAIPPFGPRSFTVDVYTGGGVSCLLRGYWCYIGVVLLAFFWHHRCETCPSYPIGQLVHGRFHGVDLVRAVVRARRCISSISVENGGADDVYNEPDKDEEMNGLATMNGRDRGKGKSVEWVLASCRASFFRRLQMMIPLSYDDLPQGGDME